jgi:signal transduction histidine kinase
MAVKRFTILLVEDNPGDARLIQESLREVAGDHFDVETADRLASAVERLRDGDVDAVLLDLALPDSSGRDTFARAKSAAPDVPIIVLTGLGDEALALKMVQEGAQDYLVKVDLSGNVLSRSIRYAIERGMTDQHVRKLNVDLEQKVRARTAELEAANEELEAFTYSVSHDLRAPIRHINGFAGVLMESADRLDAEARECVEGIHGAARRMAAMTEDLLKLARIGRQLLDLKATNLESLVELVVSELTADVGGRHIEWRIGTLPLLKCDAGLMKQAFANILDNAVKYTRRRQTARIEIGQLTVAGVLTVFIHDNGEGFDMKHADRLFAPFQRLHDAEDFEGTGVGLSTVRRIIERHGGRIWVESEVGKGTSVFFTLAPESVGLTSAMAARAASGFSTASP